MRDKVAGVLNAPISKDLIEGILWVKKKERRQWLCGRGCGCGGFGGFGGCGGII